MRVWQDEFDGVWTVHRGLPGGYSWMMVGPQALHEQLEGLLQSLPGTFKGTLYVLLLPEQTAWPLEQALQIHEPRGVLVLGQNLRSGPGQTVPENRHVTSGGLEYLEGDTLPPWTAALDLEGEEGPDLWASVCAKVGVPVVVRHPDQAVAAWQHWWQSTPLSLQNLQC